jgi:TPP-dependent pyruvate/acetoin dehydrogenase alpha subunit
VDGNDVIDCYAAVRVAAARCRAGGGPVLLVAETFRAGGHATHDEAEARRLVPAALRAAWGARDPLALGRASLLARGVGAATLDAAAADAAQEVADGLAAALASRDDRMPAGPRALGGVYAG